MLDRSSGSGKDHIGYNSLTQAAMRGVVRATLEKAARLGHLPGDHHFFVTFRTRMPGMQMADWLKDKFPDEMTIVIQHQYENFKVFENSFEIVLRFGGNPEHLRIPFIAITRFVDPSINFGVQFDPVDARPGDASASIIAPVAAAPAAPPPVEAGEGTIVSLDAFRRK